MNVGIGDRELRFYHAEEEIDRFGELVILRLDPSMGNTSPACKLEVKGDEMATPCKACGIEWCTIKFVPEKDSASGTRTYTLKAHLLYTCHRCGYAWKVPPLFAREPKDLPLNPLGTIRSTLQSMRFYVGLVKRKQREYGCRLVHKHLSDCIERLAYLHTQVEQNCSTRLHLLDQLETLVDNHAQLEDERICIAAIADIEYGSLSDDCFVRVAPAVRLLTKALRRIWS